MGEMQDWLRGQHPGLRTYRAFEEMLLMAAQDDPAHRAMYRLLSNLASGYAATFDEEPLPVDVADRAYRHLLDLVGKAESSIGVSVERQLAVLNEIAAAELY